MTKKRKIFLSIIMILLITAVSSTLFVKYQNQKTQTILNLTAEDKLSDFDELCCILDESYPFWAEVNRAGIDKETVYSTYRVSIGKTQTDIEFFKEINNFLNEFQGFGHLSVLDGYMYRVYVDTLIASNGMLTEQETQAIAPLVDVLTNSITQNTYSHLDQSHAGFRSTIGLKEEYQNMKMTGDTVEESSLLTKILDSEKVAYIKIQSFELTNYQEDKAVLADFFAAIKDIPNLIIDIRGNKGGSDLYWEDLLVEPNATRTLLSERYYLFNSNNTTSTYILANGIVVENFDSLQDPILSDNVNTFSNYTVDAIEFEAAENPYNGKIWILVDDDVYSASENFVMFCKNTGFATLVGTATGGDGGIADPILVSLPNSGLIVRFSMFYGLNPDGSGNEANGTVPDVAILENEDALDKCLALIE